MDSQVHPYYIADTTGVCTPVPNGPPPPNLPPEGPNYECPSWKLNSGPIWMGLGCLAIMSILMSRNFKVRSSLLNKLPVHAEVELRVEYFMGEQCNCQDWVESPPSLKLAWAPLHGLV